MKYKSNEKLCSAKKNLLARPIEGRILGSCTSLKRLKGISSKSNKSKRKNEFFVCSLNVRTLSSSKKLCELDEALDKIKYDVLGLSEVKKIGDDFIERPKYMMYYKGNNRRRGSVGFIINKKWKSNIM